MSKPIHQAASVELSEAKTDTLESIRSSCIDPVYGGVSQIEQKVSRKMLEYFYLSVSQLILPSSQALLDGGLANQPMLIGRIGRNYEA